MSESTTQKSHRFYWHWILGALTLVSLLIAGLVLPPSVPQFQGKTVYDWMFSLPSSSLDSSPGLTAIGTNALPYLARALATPPTPYDRYGLVRDPRTQKVLKQLGFGPRWTGSSGEIRRKAAFALLAFGFEAGPALPALHAELISPQAADRQTVIACLSELGPRPESIPFLIQAWALATNESSGVRNDLLNTIGHADSNAVPMAMPIILAALDDPQPNVRVVAVNALERWATPVPQALPKLIPLISGTNLWLAAAAGAALGRVTNQADEAVQLLRDLLAKSTNDYCRASVSITLWRLGEDADEARRFLEPLLALKEGRGIAAQYLGEMGSAAKASVPALLRASHADLGAWVDMYDRAQCARAVLRIQRESPEAVAVIEAVMAPDRNANGWIRGTVAEQVGKLGPAATPLLPALRRALKDPDRIVRHQAAEALARLTKTGSNS
jgi:HEAT repeat protein